MASSFEHYHITKVYARESKRCFRKTVQRGKSLNEGERISRDLILSEQRKLISLSYQTILMHAEAFLQA